MIRIYGQHFDGVVMEKGTDYPRLSKIKLDQKVHFEIGDRLEITLDYIQPGWVFSISNLIDIDPWQVRLKPYTAGSLLMEIDCPKDTEVKTTIWEE